MEVLGIFSWKEQNPFKASPEHKKALHLLWAFRAPQPGPSGKEQLAIFILSFLLKFQNLLGIVVHASIQEGRGRKIWVQGQVSSKNI
jgi:hypothetical protein